jgi:hypothetical protein
MVTLSMVTLSMVTLSMVTLLHRIVETFAARSPERSGALIPDDQPRPDDNSLRGIADDETDPFLDGTRLAILGQCVP